MRATPYQLEGAGVTHQDLWLELGSQASTGGITPIVLNFNAQVIGRRFYLQSYTVKGYPCTSGIPDSTHYKLRITSNGGERSEKGGVIFASRLTGGTVGTVGDIHQTPLPLEMDGYTHHHASHPQREVYSKKGNDPFHVKGFEITVTDENDNKAEFTDLNILLRIE